MAATEVPGLNAAYTALFDALMDQLTGLPGLQVVAISGSVADGTADDYSDLDLQVGVDGHSDAMADAVRSAVRRSLHVGDERWVVPGRIYSACGVDWLRVDVTLLAAGADAFAHNARIVHNPNGVDVSRAPRPSLTRDPAALTRQTTRFLRSVGLIVRDLHRGDLRLGCFAVEFLIQELITLMYQERGLIRGAQKGTYHQLPADDVAELQALPVATPERRSIVDAHEAVANAYLRRARRVASDWGAAWPSEMEEGTRKFLARELGLVLSG